MATSEAATVRDPPELLGNLPDQAHAQSPHRDDRDRYREHQNRIEDRHGYTVMPRHANYRSSATQTLARAAVGVKDDAPSAISDSTGRRDDSDVIAAIQDVPIGGSADGHLGRWADPALSPRPAGFSAARHGEDDRCGEGESDDEPGGRPLDPLKAKIRRIRTSRPTRPCWARVIPSVFRRVPESQRQASSQSDSPENDDQQPA